MKPETKRCLALLMIASAAVGACAQPARQTETVICVMVDGVRCQEVFSGADEQCLTKEAGGITDIDGFRKQYWRESPEARRAVLMPFLWGTIARHGQIYGNAAKGSVATVTNGKNFSYPGYAEALCGFADPRVDSNKKVPNPNPTLLDWLVHRPGFEGKIAVFGGWDVFPFILNSERCDYLVNAGFQPLTGRLTRRQEFINRLQAETPALWGGERYDSFTFYLASDFFEEHQPRVLYVLLGDTDEFAHSGDYAAYLAAVRRSDQYTQALWETAQKLNTYQGRTTLIVSPDHGRGLGSKEWRDHGEKTAGSENIWLAVLGPDTPPLGERERVAPVTLSQVAATIAALLGEDYNSAVARAGRPIAEALSPAHRK